MKKNILFKLIMLKGEKGDIGYYDDTELRDDIAVLTHRMDIIDANLTQDASNNKIATQTETVTAAESARGIMAIWHTFEIPEDAVTIEASYCPIISGWDPDTVPWKTENVEMYLIDSTHVQVQVSPYETSATAYLKISYAYSEASDLSELTDIRTGADGTVYASAGTAVRTQVSDVKSVAVNKNNSIKNIVALEVENQVYTMQTGKVISSAGSISNASGDGYKITDYIPVESGWIITCKYSRARWANQNWAFYDANKNAISTYGKTSSATSVEYCSKIIVPYKAKYFVAARDENGIANEPNTDITIVKKYSELMDYAPKSAVINFPSNSMVEIPYNVTNSSAKLIGSVGLITNTTGSDYLVSECDVNDQDIINIRNCQARYSNKLYAFYDASGLPILMKDREDNNPHDFTMICVPYGAVKIAVSGYGTYPTISKVTKLQISGDSWADKKWSCIGDSITDSNNARATKRYFDYIQDATGIGFVNLGLSGTGYMKSYNSNLPFHQRVDTIPVDSDVITIFGSGNDCSLPLGNVADTGTTTVCGCINSTIDSIRSRIVGAKIGIITPTPWEDYPTENVGNNMDSYCQAIVEICRRKGVPCLDLYHCSNLTPWVAAFRTAYYSRDDGNGVHPDENGHKLFASYIKAFIATLLL